jgi:hypothetical protein
MTGKKLPTNGGNMDHFIEAIRKIHAHSTALAEAA